MIRNYQDFLHLTRSISTLCVLGTRGCSPHGAGLVLVAAHMRRNYNYKQAFILNVPDTTKP